MSADAEIASLVMELSGLVRRFKVAYGRRMLGELWEGGDYWLSTYCVIEQGFHTVTYLVVDRETDAVIGAAPSKTDAVAIARRNLTQFSSDIAEARRALVQKRRANIAAAEAEMEIIRRGGRETKPEGIPRRRLEIFNKSGGKCHYCSMSLDLRGKWHIEHMMPRALLGSNEPENLVAACVPCNMKKRDMTAEEFIAKREAA